MTELENEHLVSIVKVIDLLRNTFPLFLGVRHNSEDWLEALGVQLGLNKIKYEYELGNRGLT